MEGPEDVGRLDVLGATRRQCFACLCFHQRESNFSFCVIVLTLLCHGLGDCQPHTHTIALRDMKRLAIAVHGSLAFP